MVKILYVVEYNDCYGNGTNKKLEVIVESELAFEQWLKKHNEDRRMDYLDDDDFVEESAEEFTLKPLKYIENNQLV
jgi:hypothetical protein